MGLILGGGDYIDMYNVLVRIRLDGKDGGYGLVILAWVKITHITNSGQSNVHCIQYMWLNDNSHASPRGAKPF